MPLYGLFSRQHSCHSLPCLTLPKNPSALLDANPSPQSVLLKKPLQTSKPERHLCYYLDSKHSLV
jgi:hypothetical protein